MPVFRMGRRGPVLLVLVWIVAMAVGCDESFGPEPDTSLNDPLRIVSLAPALTRMIVDLGREDLIVGVALNDDAAPPDKPIVGTAWDVDSEALLRARPTHVVMMVGKDGPDARLRDLANSQGFELVVYPYPDTVEQIGRILCEQAGLLAGAPGRSDPAFGNGEAPPDGDLDSSLPGDDMGLDGLNTPTDASTPDNPRAGDPSAAASHQTTIGLLVLRPTQAFELWLSILERLGALQALTLHAANVDKPSVLLVISVEGGVMAEGPGTVNDQLLTLFVNARNAAAGASVRAPTYDAEGLLALEPDVILLLMPGAPPMTDFATDPRLSSLRGLDIPAVRDQRVTIINDPFVLLPSTNLPRTAAAMAKAIYPELAPRIDAVVTPVASEVNADEQATGELETAREDEAVDAAPVGGPALDPATESAGAVSERE